jgi:hypothetical protein
MSVNNAARQTSGKTIFQSLVKGGGCCGTNGPTEVVEIATLCEFDESDRFSTTFCDPVWVTLSDFFTHFTMWTYGMALKKNA